jgi:hypothetical protein
VQLFHHTNTGDFLCCLWKAVGNQRQQHTHPIGNKECQQQLCETDSDWSEPAYGKYMQAGVNSSPLPMKKMVGKSLV